MYYFILIFLMAACGGTGRKATEHREGPWPISGTKTPDPISAPFGPRVVDGVYSYHLGMDIPAEADEKVFAITDGTVVKVADTQPGEALDTYGKYIVIAHGTIPGVYDSQIAYLHLDRTLVSEGNSVIQGEYIGRVGSTGVGVEKAHLHIEYFKGISSGEINTLFARNPLRILPYTKANPTVQIEKDNSQIKVIIAQKPESTDIVKLTIAPEGQDPKIIHFETLEGLNRENLSQNTYENVTINPNSFSEETESYQFSVVYKGNFASAGTLTISLEDVNGTTHKETF